MCPSRLARRLLNFLIPDMQERQVMQREPDLTVAQRGIKVGTALLTAVVLTGLLLADWGPNTVFSGIRPAVKAQFNRLYGIEDSRDK